MDKRTSPIGEFRKFLISYPLLYDRNENEARISERNPQVPNPRGCPTIAFGTKNFAFF